MSKDSNLRLLGSPVNLTYRGKKKEDKKNTRNRPRSALQNSCFTPDIPEKHKRPFSADAKQQAPSTRSFLKSFSAELLQSYQISPSNVKVVPPTTELLASEKQTFKKEKDLCSNASDYGSEDTYISLGTKIKDKAQATTKTRNSNQRNFLKYRSIARKGRKNMKMNNQQVDNDKTDNYGLEVKIIEKAQRPLRSPSPPRRSYYDDQAGSLSPAFTVTPYESYFVPLDSESRDSLIGRVSFGNPSSYSDTEQGIDACSRRSNMIKQQLSLVEEESTQDLESIRSHNNVISRQNSKEELNQNGQEVVATGRDYVTEIGGNVYPKNIQNNVGSQLSYGNFYDDFHSNTGDSYKLSSTVVHTDTSSKDSGYPDSGTNDEKSYRQNYSFPPSCLKKSYSNDKLEQPKSLDCSSTGTNTKNYQIEKNTWAEPLNHSRLLYKDFFLKKEGHIAVPPNNSPTTNRESESIPGCSQTTQNEGRETLKYPSYLLNSTTKAYTSKVIEDYKKELEAINNLHELTIKDMQTDAISPTPLNLDKMFDEHSVQFENDIEKSSYSLENSVEEDLAKVNENTDKRDVSKVSTKELIQNYMKVKEGDYSRNVKKFEKKVSNVSAKDLKQDWNNKSPKSPNKTTILPLKHHNTRNVFSVSTPLSARIDGVQNDKDIDSWMSLTAPSPRVLESDIDNIDTPKTLPEVSSPIQEEPQTPVIEKQTEVPKTKELNPGSTVLDIYSMLKEIESYGDNPVTSVSKVPEVDVNSTEKADEKSPSPRDNFMEIFEFLEKVEQSANDALSIVTNTPQQSTPKLEVLLKLPQTELAQRLVTASLQLEERSCCIALLQESLASHKEQMINKVSNLEKQSYRNISKVKQECEEAIKRHQNFIDQLINDKKTLNHRIEQLVEERRSLEERWKRAAQALEERYKLQLKNQHDKMAAAQQVARQRWVRQKAEKIKELTVKGLEGELREMAERQQKEIADLKMSNAEQTGRIQAKHAHDLEELRRSLEEEREMALVKERQVASARMEKQILELELTYQEQRTRLVSEMRAENERVANSLCEKEREQRHETDKWREDQERILEEKRRQFEADIATEKEKNEEKLKQKQWELEQKFEQYKRDYEKEKQMSLKRKVTEIAGQHKLERDREIEKAIERMEAEAQAGRKELQDALRRNKEQYELELKELAQTEQATLRRYQDSQARIRQTEDKCAEMEITISQLETRNRVLTEKSSQLEQRAEEIRAGCEDSWRKKVDALVKEAEDTRKTHDEQMHQLYAKVKVAVARKDSAIQALTREAGKYQEKITLLEQKLQQQRKDFLAKK